jgi:type IV pilus assembly protein PilA
MYSFRKSKKGFTLIELMVVVAIIGVLALLGLRVYTGQMDKSKNSIVKANSATVHTLIQGEIADNYTTDVTDMLSYIGASDATDGTLANMKNPFDNTTKVVNGTDGATGTPVEGQVTVTFSTDHFVIQGYGKNIKAVGDPLTAWK